MRRTRAINPNSTVQGVRTEAWRTAGRVKIEALQAALVYSLGKLFLRMTFSCKLVAGVFKRGHVISSKQEV